MNEALRARLAGIRGILMAHFHASTLLPDATKSAERETLVREFLQRGFPAPGCPVIRALRAGVATLSFDYRGLGTVLRITVLD